MIRVMTYTLMKHNVSQLNTMEIAFLLTDYRIKKNSSRMC